MPIKGLMKLPVEEEVKILWLYTIKKFFINLN